MPAFPWFRLGLVALSGVGLRWLTEFVLASTGDLRPLVLLHVGLLVLGVLAGFAMPNRLVLAGFATVGLFPVMDVLIMGWGDIIMAVVILPIRLLQGVPGVVGSGIAAGLRDPAHIAQLLRVHPGAAGWGLAALAAGAGAGVVPLPPAIDYLARVGILFVTGTLLAARTPRLAWRSGILLVVGFLGSIVLQIIVDVLSKTASHRLLPIELWGAFLASVPTAMAGAYVGRKLGAGRRNH